MPSGGVLAVVWYNKPMLKKVLIFEDNPSLQTLLRLFFRKRGFEVFIEGDGVNAVARVAEVQPALIIMDVIMPGKDGIEACTELRRSGEKTPIIMLTSKNMAGDEQRGLAAGANAYLLKPFDTRDLDRAIAPLVK